jgi:tetratricopeptide (TPR) repeat protein
MPPKSVPKDVRAVSIPKTGADAPFAVLPIVSSIDISTRPTTPASVDNDDDDDSDLPELVAGQEDEYSEEENGTKKPAVPKKRGGGIGATEKSISDETKGRTCARLGCGAKINDYSSDRCMRHTQKDRAAIPVYPHKNMLPSASDTGKKSKPTTAVTPTQSPVVAKSSLRMQTSSRVVLASTVVLPESIVGALPAAAEKLKEEGKMQQLAPHRNYKRAIELYTQSLKLAPRHIERAKILGNRSACYVELGDWEAAIADAKLAIQIDKTYVRGYTRLEDAVAGLALQNPVGAVGGELPRTSPKSQRQHSVDDQLPRLVSGGDDDDDDDDDEYLNFDGEGDDVEVDGQGEGEWKGDAQNEQGDADDDDDDEKEDDEETKEWKPDDLVYRNSAASDRKGSSESKRSASLEPAAIVKVLDGPDFSECIKSQRTDYAAHKYSAVERNINTILKPYGIQLPRSAFELALIRAQIRCATRKYEIAAKDGELITTIWPDRSESWAIRGRATFALGTHHLQKALECYRKVLFEQLTSFFLRDVTLQAKHISLSLSLSLCTTSEADVSFIHSTYKRSASRGRKKSFVIA